jgi:hypothetical protein
MFHGGGFGFAPAMVMIDDAGMMFDGALVVEEHEFAVEEEKADE